MTILRNQQHAARSLRAATGLSQVALAQALGVTQPTVSRWERFGIMRQSNLDALRRLVRYTDARKRATGADEIPLRELSARLAHATLNQLQGRYEIATQILHLLRQEDKPTTSQLDKPVKPDRVDILDRREKC